MNQEKYTERMRGFLQSAQMLALREGHQRLVPDHLLKVLLDDPEGLAAVGEWEAEHGPLTGEELAAARRRVAGPGAERSSA